MEHSFDIFEVLPGGDLLWKTAVDGRAAAMLRLQQMGAGERNEFRLMNLYTLSVISAVNRHPMTNTLCEPLHAEIAPRYSPLL